MTAGKSRRVMSALLIAGLLLPVLSCKTLGLSAFASPVITLRDVRLEAISLTGGSLKVEVGIRNPNGYRLDARRVTYRLIVDSTELGSGGVDTAMTVQAGDSVLLQLPIRFNFLGLGAVARQMQSGGALSYRVAGELTIATPVGRLVQPYDQLGSFALFGKNQMGGMPVSRDH